MQYKQIILDFIANDDMPGFHSWRVAQPPIEQSDIMRAFKEVMQEIAVEMDFEIPQELVEKIDTTTNQYEETILDAQLLSLKIDVVNKQRQKVLERLKKNADTTDRKSVV